MNHDSNHPFQPVFRFMLGSIRGYALCFLCLVTPWLWPVLIAGFLGGIWARRRQAALNASPIISLPPAIPPPLPAVVGNADSRSPSDGIQSFSA